MCDPPDAPCSSRSDSTGRKAKRPRASPASQPSDAHTNVLDANPFAVLSGSQQQQNRIVTNGEKIERRVKVPPFFTSSRDIKTIREQLGNLKLSPTYKLCSTGIKINCPDMNQYNSVGAFLKQQGYEFYTHDVASLKPLKVMLRGLPVISIENLKAELINVHGLQPVAIHPISRGENDTYGDCLYLIHLQKGTTTISKLKMIKAIFQIIVRWEPYRPQHRDVTQCAKCLHFGHGTKNCHMQVRCGTCAGKHATNDCAQDNEAEPKCVNCGSNHKATSKTCPKRADFIRIRHSASTRNQPHRRKEPLFCGEDFPPLPPRRSIPILAPLPVNSRLAAAAASVPPPIAPPQPSQHKPRIPTQSSDDLFSAEQLTNIFIEMSQRLRSCKSRYDQIQTLGLFIIQYGV